jgi:hypothetical protein
MLNEQPDRPTWFGTMEGLVSFQQLQLMTSAGFLIGLQ